MPSKFKVGDKVQFKEDNPNGGTFFGAKGDIATIDNTPMNNWQNYGPQVTVKLDKGGLNFNPSVPISCIELVEKPRSFKVGDRVRISDISKLGNNSLEPGSIHSLFEKGTSLYSQIWFLDRHDPFTCVFEAGLELVEEPKTKTVHHEGWVRMYKGLYPNSPKHGYNASNLVWDTKEGCERRGTSDVRHDWFAVKAEWDEEVTTQSVDRDNLVGLDWTDDDFI